MKILWLIPITLISFTAYAQVENKSDSSIWDTFKNAPKVSNLKNLDSVTKSPVECEYVAKDFDSNVSKSYEYIKKNKGLYASAFIKLSKCLDGGNLGDAYRALGEYFDSQPQKAFKELKGSMTDEQIASVLVMVPEKLVDNFAAQNKLMGSRLKKLKSVKPKPSSIITDKLTQRTGSAKAAPSKNK